MKKRNEFRRKPSICTRERHVPKVDQYIHGIFPIHFLSCHTTNLSGPIHPCQTISSDLSKHQHSSAIGRQIPLRYHYHAVETGVFNKTSLASFTGVCEAEWTVRQSFIPPLLGPVPIEVTGGCEYRLPTLDR